MTEAEHPRSYYLATAKGQIRHPRLHEKLRVDVAVIGGGYTGLSAALNLAERGYQVALLEARRIAWGASGRNGGQVGTGQRQSQAALEKLVGAADARMLWSLAEEAKAEVRRRIELHEIDCDYRAGILHVAHKPGRLAELEAEAAYLRDIYGYEKIRLLDRQTLAGLIASERYHGASLDLGAGHLHPLNYALGLARAATAAGVRIFERSPVESLEAGRPNLIRTPQGEVRADAVVVACNGYLDRLMPRLAGRIMPINNYIIATEPLDGPLGEKAARRLVGEDYAVADTKFVVDYFRMSPDRRLLFGGGETYRRSFPKDIAAFVKPYMLKVFPQLKDVKIDYAWGGTLAITLNRMPSFGRLAGDVYYAQGFSGHGLAMTGIAGKLIAEAVAGQQERFDLLARVPQPRFPGGTLLRWPGLVAGMLYYSLRDRL